MKTENSSSITPRTVILFNLLASFAWITAPLFAHADGAAAENTPTASPGLTHVQEIDFRNFLARQDMVWDKVPTDWLQAPCLGNGMLGLMLFQEGASAKNSEATDEKNILSLHVGRGDYYDNRPPDNGHHTWIYRGRLPIGFFRIRSNSDVTSADWRLDLWNAKLVGTVKTSVGSYEIEGFVHSQHDSFFFKVTPAGGEQVSFEWQPQEAYCYPRQVSEQAKERAPYWGPSRFHRKWEYHFPRQKTISQTRCRR